MRKNTKDETVNRNYIQKWRFYIREYELVKAGKHPQFRFVSDFYKFHNLNRQTFLKYYHRYKNSGSELDLLPRKRGAKWKTGKPIAYIEHKVIELRKKGINRYEIYAILKVILKDKTPSPSGIYNICRRYGYNRLNKPMKTNKRRIIKNKAGELGHIDCHHLSKDLIVNDKKRYYLVGVLDSCTRVAWAEVVEDIKSITVMFATLKAINFINQEYNIQFEEVLTDNGAEFASKKNTRHHPFERMLIELGIKHRYTRAYRPQTNGKVERFWRTVEEEMIEGTTFETVDELKDELMQYLVYYNELRPHQGINAKTPKQFREACK